MEFERNAPTTAEDLALADTPKVTIQPAHELEAMPVIADRSHRTDGSFPFETESTAPAALTSSELNSRAHHRLALTVSTVIVLVFFAAVVSLFLLR